MQKRVLNINALTLWLLASVFSLFQFFLQVASSMMTHQYASSFLLSPVKVGLLSSAFFYGYVLVQIPAGVLLDYFPVRRILLSAALVCALGTLGFSMAPNVLVAAVMRFIMGLGAGFAFVSMVFSVGQYLPFRLFPLFVGLGEFIAMFGTALAEHGVPYLVVGYGWRWVMGGASIVCLLLWVLMFFMLKPLQLDRAHLGHWQRALWQGVKQVVALPVPWLAGVFALGVFGVITVFNALWGVPFLMTAHHLSYYQATSGIAWSLIGVAVGAPVLGAISAKIGRPYPVMFVVTIAALLTSLVLLWAPILSVGEVYALLMLLGFFGSGNILAFSAIARMVPNGVQGAAIGLCNGICLAGAIVFQPVVGGLLSFFKQTQAPAHAFTLALTILPIVLVVALFALWALVSEHLCYTEESGS